MTLKQLLYAVTVAETGNITDAAKKLFIAQPSLTAAIHELEKEYGIVLFARSNKGMEVTPDGEEFLGYARQVLEQANLIEERYRGRAWESSDSVYPPSIIPLRWKLLSGC